MTLLILPLIWAAAIFLLRQIAGVIWLSIISSYLLLTFILTMKGVTGDYPADPLWQSLRTIHFLLSRLLLASLLTGLYLVAPLAFYLTTHPEELRNIFAQ